MHVFQAKQKGDTSKSQKMRIAAAFSVIGTVSFTLMRLENWSTKHKFLSIMSTTTIALGLLIALKLHKLQGPLRVDLA